jgi:hypothetical protein
MFSVFRRHRELQRLRQEIPLMQGQITALVALVGLIINRTDEAQRKVIISGLKTVVGQGLGGEAKWLKDEDKQTYNDALSVTIQTIIEENSEP